MSENTARIRALNDAFRKTCNPPGAGKYYITRGVAALGGERTLEIIKAVANFDDFTAGNDPYGEHDFGSMELAGETIFWKIDYHATDDPGLGSEDPSDSATTERVLTIMLSEEY